MPAQDQSQTPTAWHGLEAFEVAAQEYERRVELASKEQIPAPEKVQPAEISFEDWWALQNGN